MSSATLNPVSFNRMAALLCALMLAALVAVVAGAIHRFAPQWQPIGIVIAAFLVALEASIVHHTSQEEHLGMGDMMRYLVPELVVLAIMMRLVTSMSLPHGSIEQTLSTWLYDPLSILDALFVVHMLIGVLIGFLAHRTMGDLRELSPSPFDSADTRREGHQRVVVVAAAERTQALARIGGRFGIGAGLLLLALSLEAVNLSRVGGAPNPLSTLSVAAALVYLVSGFMLYSRARLAVLQSRWQMEGAHVAPTVQRRWSRGSLLLIGGIVGLAALLPRSYGMGLVDTLRTILAAIGYAFAILGYLVTYLFGIMLMLPAWLLSLLLPDNAPVPAGAPPPPMPPPPPQVLEREPPLWPALIFWLCVAVLLGRAVSIVLQRHPGIFAGVTGWLAFVWAFLAELWGDTRMWVDQAAVTVRQRFQQPSQARVHGPPRLRLSSLNPRQLIAYYYHATLQRAGQQGNLRRPGQTPEEYRAQLAAQLPETAEDIGALTDAFVRATYAPHPISADDARKTRVPFERLKRLLQRARQRP